MHSLPVSISPKLTSVVALHYYSVLFLRPFPFRCPPFSSISMTTRSILLNNGTPASKRPLLEGPASFMPLLGLLLFDVLTLIKGLVTFRLHNHQYFYREPSLGDFQPRLKSASPDHETWLFPAGRQPGYIKTTGNYHQTIITTILSASSTSSPHCRIHTPREGVKAHY